MRNYLLKVSIWPVGILQFSSIGDGGSGPCCAKNPTQKNVPKTPPRKNRFDWKPQGQIFQECQECQGQISQGQMGNPKNGQSEKSKNSKVKYFRNVRNAKVKFPKVKWEIQKMANQKNPKIPRSNISEKEWEKNCHRKVAKLKSEKCGKRESGKNSFLTKSIINKV